MKMNTKVFPAFAPLMILIAPGLAIAVLFAGCASTQSMATATALSPAGSPTAQRKPAATAVAAPAATDVAINNTLMLPANCEGRWETGAYNGTVVISNLRASDDGKVVTAMVTKDGRFTWRPDFFGRDQKATGYIKNAQTVSEQLGGGVQPPHREFDDA